MSLDSSPLTVRVPLSLELQRGVATTITAPLFRDGAAVDASAASAVLYDAAGEVVQSEASALSGTVATWAITPASTVTLGAGYRVEWEITHAGGVIYPQFSAAVVRRNALHPVIAQGDLFRRDPTLDPAHVGFILSESITDLQDIIDEAWTEILGRVWAQGNRPHLIMSPASLRAPHLYLSLSIAYRSSPNAENLETAADYQSMYEAAWASLRWVYDSDDDGAPDDSGLRKSGTPVLWTC